MQVTVEIDEDEFDKLIVKGLMDAYAVHKNHPMNAEYDKKMCKAIKRVIEYYGGNVDE